MRLRNKRGFTLVELLVVISIIVILLAIMIPSLKNALRKADQTKCAAGQRGIAQVLVGYSLNSKRNFPPSVRTTAATVASGAVTYNKSFAYAMDYRANDQLRTTWIYPRDPDYFASATRRSVLGGLTAMSSAALTIPKISWEAATANPDVPGSGSAQEPLGLGVLVVTGLLPATKLGEIANCPSLNTSSSIDSPNFGTDNVYTVKTDAANNDKGEPIASSMGPGAGGSFYVDPMQNTARIIGSYNYRGLSYAMTHGGAGVIQYYQVGADFVVLADFPDVRFGKRFSHLNGYNVAYGDGHVNFFIDTPDADGYGIMEKGQPGTSGDPNMRYLGIPQYSSATPLRVDGVGTEPGTFAKPGSIDEHIYTKFLGK